MSGIRDMYAIAEERDLDIVLPGARELQIDIDDALSMARFEQTLAILNGYYHFPEVKRTTSAGGNTHITLEVPEGFGEVTAVMRIALQACFGSDLTREALSLIRVVDHPDVPPTCFFEVRD